VVELLRCAICLSSSEDKPSALEHWFIWAFWFWVLWSSAFRLASRSAEFSLLARFLGDCHDSLIFGSFLSAVRVHVSNDDVSDYGWKMGSTNLHGFMSMILNGFNGFPRNLHVLFRFSIVHCSVAPQIQASMGREELLVILYRTRLLVQINCALWLYLSWYSLFDTLFIYHSSFSVESTVFMHA
jgi:hypothetical protein